MSRDEHNEPAPSANVESAGNSAGTQRADSGSAAIISQVLRMVRKLRERQEEIAKKRGITLLQYLAIQMLRRDGNLNVTQLAEKLQLKHSTVSKLVDRMERDRLLIRVQSSDDRRASKLRLTELALERVDGLSLSVADFSKRLLGYLTPKEQTQLVTLLAKLSIGFKTELDKLNG